MDRGELEDSSDEGDDSVNLEDVLVDSESDDELAPLKKAAADGRVESAHGVVKESPAEENKLESMTEDKETPQGEEQFLCVTEPRLTPTPSFERQETGDRETFDPLEAVGEHEARARVKQVGEHFARPIEEVMMKNSLSVHRIVYSQLKGVGTALSSLEHEKNWGRPSCICVR